MRGAGPGMRGEGCGTRGANNLELPMFHSHARPASRVPRPASDPTHPPGERVENAIHELGALHAAIALGELHPFLNHDARRGLAAEELGRTHAEHRALHDTEAVEAPVRRHFGELRIQLLAVLRDSADEQARDLAFLRRDREIVPDLRSHPLESLLAAKIPRIQRLEDTGARAGLNSRPWHRVG